MSGPVSIAMAAEVIVVLVILMIAATIVHIGSIADAFVGWLS